MSKLYYIEMLLDDHEYAIYAQDTGFDIIEMGLVEQWEIEPYTYTYCATTLKEYLEDQTGEVVSITRVL